jgi:DNA-directed RNA polymerase specialized sigma24 family protein
VTDDLSTMIASDDPGVGFRAVAALRRLADQVEESAVGAARARGWSWEQIGDALGVSRQSVHVKYGRRRRRR